MPAAGLSSEEDQSSAYRPFYNPVAAKPVTVNEWGHVPSCENGWAHRLLDSMKGHFSQLGLSSGPYCSATMPLMPGTTVLARGVGCPLLSRWMAWSNAHGLAFLSWLRLSVYLAIVSVAMILSFHLRKSPTRVERQMALPLGLIFWVLALLCLSSGLANYIKSVTKYSQRQALVQSGWKTETVGWLSTANPSADTAADRLLDLCDNGDGHRRGLHTVAGHQR